MDVRRKTERRNVAQNRRARFDYELGESLEAGLVLLGSEVKSLRQGKASLEEAWVAFDAQGRLVLMNCHIPPYPQANRQNHEPLRPRPLLVSAQERARLRQKVRERGYTLVPVQLYFKGPWVKLEVALGRGRKVHDKRASLREADDRREMDRALRRR